MSNLIIPRGTVKCEHQKINLEFFGDRNGFRVCNSFFATVLRHLPGFHPVYLPSLNVSEVTASVYDLGGRSRVEECEIRSKFRDGYAFMLEGGLALIVGMVLSFQKDKSTELLINGNKNILCVKAGGEIIPIHLNLREKKEWALDLPEADVADQWLSGWRLFIPSPCK